MKLNNPFLVRGYFGKEYFCDREKETKSIITSLENEGDVTLIAPRRFGKTGLIHNVFEHLGKEWTTVYLDIFATSNLAEFTSAFASAIVGALDTKIEKAMNNVIRIFKSCRPTIIPQESGMPKFSFDVTDSTSEITLKEVFDYLKEHERKIVIAIDEFQQVLEYPENGAEALLRSQLQSIPWVRFIFAGSRQHLMREMFLSAKHPFYQSTDILSLQPIERTAYMKFAKGFFSGNRKPFDEDAFYYAYDRFDGVTWYVQMVLRQLWAEDSGVADSHAVKQAIEAIVDTRQFEFYDLYQAQTDSAKRLLKAIAADDAVASPLAGDFIARHGLKATSTVASTLKDLTERDLLYRTTAGYVVYDRFFGVWLKERS